MGNQDNSSHQRTTTKTRTLFNLFEQASKVDYDLHHWLPEAGMGILILLFFFFPDRALILKIKKVNGLNFTWPSVNLSIFGVLTRVNRRLLPYAYSSQIDLSEKINLLKIWFISVSKSFKFKILWQAETF